MQQDLWWIPWNLIGFRGEIYKARMNKKTEEMGQDSCWTHRGWTLQGREFVPLLLIGQEWKWPRWWENSQTFWMSSSLGLNTRSLQALPGKISYPAPEDLGYTEGRNWSCERCGYNPFCGKWEAQAPAGLSKQPRRRSVFDNPACGTASLIHLYIPST